MPGVASLLRCRTDIDHNRLCTRIDPRMRRELHRTDAIPVVGTCCFGRRRPGPTVVGAGKESNWCQRRRRWSTSIPPSLAVGDGSTRIIPGQSTFRQLSRMQCDVAARLAALDASGIRLQLVSTGARDQCHADGSSILQLVAEVDGIQIHRIGMIH
jgi:hypothetical protein